ncbi:hypothetical protein JCM6882_004082 [Rhodosporidiobolus microsporus]
MLQHLPHHLSHSLLPALRSLPSSAPSSFAPADLKAWYTASATDPLHPALVACAGWSALVWVLGEVTGNVSHVDRLWPFLPLFYSAHFTFYPLLAGLVSSVNELDRRMLLVFALQCCWSARLTWQSARRGFLDPRSEDYRWPIVRRALPPLAFKLLNLIFVALIQNVLLLAAELPQYLLLTHYLASSSHVSALARLKPHHAQTGGHVQLNVADAVLAALFVATLVVEMKADNQQQRFQKMKHAAIEKQRKGVALSREEQKAVERGFVADGLWSWSRHPNFACEQTTWYLLYAFTVLPFLPVSQSLTSHPLTTLTSLLHPSSLPALFGHSKSLLLSLSAHTPSLDELLTSLEHPVAFVKLHLSDPRAALSSLPALKLAALRALRVAYAEVKADDGTLWNYSIVAPLSMSALFVASTDLTERITGGKYPLYKTYRRRVAQFWPGFTPLKGLWLALTGGRRGRVDRRIWGEGEGGGTGGKGGKGKGKRE